MATSTLIASPTTSSLADAFYKSLVFVLAKHLDERLCLVPVDGPCMCDVVTHLWQELLVKVNK